MISSLDENKYVLRGDEEARVLLVRLPLLTLTLFMLKCITSQRILREARSWKIAMSGEHPDRHKILPLLGVFTVPSDEKFLPALVSELCEGNLSDHIKKGKPTPQNIGTTPFGRISTILLFLY